MRSTDQNIEKDNSSDLLGPWVFGMCTDKNNDGFFEVSDRTANTLIPIIQDNISILQSVKYGEINGGRTILWDK